MPESMLLRRLLLPELKFLRSWRKPGTVTLGVEAEKRSEMEVCPRCATPSQSTYDHRVVSIRDAPMRGLAVRLIVPLTHERWPTQLPPPGTLEPAAR